MLGKDGMGFLERAAEVLDLPADAVAGLVRVEIIGTREIFIENHKGILEYTDVEVKINAGKKILRITGDRLTVTAMSANEIKLCGNIGAVEFIAV